MNDFDEFDEKSTFQRITGNELHEAIANGDVDEFQRLVKEGAPMEIKNSHGLTPLQVVCSKKDAEMVSTLLRAGCQVNAKSSSGGQTALSIAAFVGSMDIFEVLSNHGADLDCTDDHGWTPLHEAVLGKSVEVVEHVCKIRPKMKYKACKQGRTPLHLAAFCDSPRPVLKAILAPEDTLELPKYKDENGRTISQMANLHSSYDWGELLSEDV